MATYRVQATFEVIAYVDFTIECDSPPGQESVREFQERNEEHLENLAESIVVIMPPEFELIGHDVDYVITHLELEDNDGRQDVQAG